MDPFVLLSVINTKLRDFYDNLDDLCEDLNYDKKEITDELKKICYYYDEEKNCFLKK